MSIEGSTIAFLVANEGVEQVELTEPWQAVEKAGATPKLVSLDSGQVQAFRHLDKGESFPVDLTVDDAVVEDFAGLVLPGGVANPDRLRQDQQAVELVQRFFQAGKPVAAICHAPWMLVEADVLGGRRLTSYPSLRTDIVNAGGEWVDEQVVVDESGSNVLITSRNPDDLEAFTAEIVARF